MKTEILKERKGRREGEISYADGERKNGKSKVEREGNRGNYGEDKRQKKEIGGGSTRRYT